MAKELLNGVTWLGTARIDDEIWRRNSGRGLKFCLRLNLGGIGETKYQDAKTGHVRRLGSNLVRTKKISRTFLGYLR